MDEIEEEGACEKVEVGGEGAEGSARVDLFVCSGGGAVLLDDAGGLGETSCSSVRGLFSGAEVGSRAWAFRQDLYAATLIGVGKLYFLVRSSGSIFVDQSKTGSLPTSRSKSTVLGAKGRSHDQRGPLMKLGPYDHGSTKAQTESRSPGPTGNRRCCGTWSQDWGRLYSIALFAIEMFVKIDFQDRMLARCQP